MNEHKFSYFQSGISQTTNAETITIDDLLEQLKSSYNKELIDKIRNINLTNIKEEKKEKNKLKRYLGYVTPSGIFSERKKIGLIEQSGLAPIDIDDIENPEELKNQLKMDKHIFLAFSSPSGKGLKILIKIPKDLDTYSDRVNTFYGYLEKAYNINIESLDRATSDISRACYLSYDPEYYYNPDSEEFTFIEKSVKNRIKKTDDNSRSAWEFRQILKMLYLGKTRQKIFEYAEANFNKWNEATESYRELTFEKAKQLFEQNPPNKETINSIINDLSEEIENKFNIYTLRSDKNPEMYIYEEGIYRSEAKTFIYSYIKDCLGKYYSKQFADRIIEKIIPDTYIDIDKFFNEESPEFVCVENGILNLFTGKLESFTPEKRFFSKLPIKYDPKANCEKTINQFKTILYEEDIDAMQELYGYLLYRQYNIQKAFIFSGSGSNGKSATINQMRTFLGDKNCVNISLQSLETKHFMKGNLHKKLVNLADDIGNAALTETNTFKELTGSGMITADIKHSLPVSFVNYAKMIFNANEIPRIEEDTDGFWRRWIIIRFDAKFLDEYEYNKTIDKKRNKKIYIKDGGDTEKILQTPEELSGVLNWAIEGFKRLYENKAFSYNKTIADTRSLMKRFSSNTIAFIQDCLEDTKNPEYFEKIDDLYKKYCDYCLSRKNEERPVLLKDFKKQLINEFPTEEKRIGTARELRILYYKFIGIPEDL